MQISRHKGPTLIQELHARFTIVNIPVHVDPSPVNPGLQTQMKEPSRLVQLAFLSHGWDSLEHSSISDMNQKDKTKAWINILSE